jgi:putative membrane protein
MVVVGLVLAAAAALVHIFIFYLESIAWTGDRARATFGTSEQEALTTKLLAFNQGFYNLFLAIAVILGIVFVAAGATVAGATLVFAGTGSMAAAATVLVISSPDKAGAALKQGVVPALAVIALALAAREAVEFLDDPNAETVPDHAATLRIGLYVGIALAVWLVHRGVTEPAKRSSRRRYDTALGLAVATALISLGVANPPSPPSALLEAAAFAALALWLDFQRTKAAPAVPQRRPNTVRAAR